MMGFIFASETTMHDTWPELTLTDIANVGCCLWTSSDGGTVNMGSGTLDGVTECPSTGYEQNSYDMELGDVLCVLTRDGEYAKIKITAYDDGVTTNYTTTSFTFDWVYQPDGGTDFTVGGTTTSSTTTIPGTTTTSTTTTIQWECSLIGDTPPCGIVELGEVIDFINLWAVGNAELSEVIDLINAWASTE